ncbi:MAG: diacylglycerol kinase [Novosphingobium sp.]|nr:diacylglycerol kinase [Novosphingobium sp.]
MLRNSKVWLVRNALSGSNSEAALAALVEALHAAGAELRRIVAFPDEPAPTPDALRAAGVDVVAVFTGDGSIHAVVTGLYGWEGLVMVLPGGTMNLLSGRLHGDADALEIIARTAAGKARRHRPTLIRSRHGDALTGVLAGPGAAWNGVREAIREPDVASVVASVTDAIGVSTSGASVVCRDPARGREDGYTALMLTPGDDGFTLDGYYAASLADYARQGIALLRRNFRDGPHDELGAFADVVLACPQGEPMELLIDGEPLRAGAEERFTLARCAVDLLATAHG